MNKLIVMLFIIVSLIMQGCVPQSVGRRVASDGIATTNIGNNPGGGVGSINQDDPLNRRGTTTVTTKVELFHIVDPFDESFKSKVTIPKNFSGTLYIGGININSLKDKWVYVKFKFGREYEDVTVPAVVGQAIEGITPRTNVEVLILHMDDKPFDHLRLSYDLYDYNDYSGGKDPVTDPRNVNLYCRGLNLVDDSSFSGGTSCTGSDQTCKYAYAKILDRGLLTNEDMNNRGHELANSAEQVLTPTTQQIALGSTGLFSNETFNAGLLKCLPDTDKTSGINTLFNTSLDEGVDMTIGRTVRSNGSLYYKYNGPFQPINVTNWQLSGDAAFGNYGIFKKSYLGPNNITYGFESLLFPRVGKKELSAGVEYLGSVNPFDLKTKTSLSTSGKSLWMDGCNIRVSNYDSYTNEGIQSCNVTARVEVIVKDPDTGAEETRVSSKDIKLQLIRESLTDNQGTEFLYSAMKTCSSNNACGADECCYNDRCWSKDLITACLDDSTGHGDLSVGEACTSDYQCQSLCCNASTGTCAVHNPGLADPVYCSKQPGQSCVAKEWCQKQNVTRCFIVTTGTTPTGQTTCTMRCYNVPTFPSCIDGKCVPKASEAPPAFDPANPDCKNAKTPDEVNNILMGI